MKPLAIYALEVLACSGVLLAAYAILLDRRVRFGWCRAYLLASTLLAAVIPLLRIPVWPGEVVEVAPTVALPATEWTAEVVEEAAPAVTPETVCLTVYLIGVGLVAGVMLWQVVRIRRLRRGAAITRTERFTLVRTPQRIASFSFFRSIYVWDQIPAGELQAIVAHEASHVAHRHSAERVAMECMKAALWWNPFVWLAARRLTEAEEFEADSDVLAEGYDIEHYMKTIFRQLFGYSPEIANGLRDSLTKKRFKMMTTKTSGRHSLLRLAGTLPAVIGLLCAFSLTTRAAEVRIADNDGEPEVFFKAAYMLNDTEVSADKIRQTDVRYSTTRMGDEIPDEFKGRDLDFIFCYTTDGKPHKVKTIDIEGRIRFPDGRAAENISVYAGHPFTVPTSKSERERLCAQTDADGRYHIKGPAEGEITYALGQFAIGGSSYKSNGGSRYMMGDLEIPYPDSARWEKAVDDTGKVVLTNRIPENDDQPGETKITMLSKKVSLTVLQNGKPLPGAIVLISGSNVGTVTGKEGTAQISAAPGNELTISYVGFETQKIRVSDKSGAESHVIALKAEDNNLDAVSVTPGDNKTAADNENASMRKASLTINLADADGRIAGAAVGAAVVISGTKKGVVADAAGHARIEAPEGAVLKISYPDYRPASVEVGDQSDYVVLLSPESDRTNRKSSPDSGGKPGPIFVVDGVEQASIDDIDPNTIERISVLKNQSSIAVYGSRGKNGVIVVTTKGAGKPATDEVVFNEKTGSVEITSASTEDMPFLIAEKMPLFQGGNLNAFRTWVQEHLQYPAEAVKRNIQGRVVVTFTIEKDGSVSNIQILQSPDKLLADEARRVIASSPTGAWTPGEQRGEKVSVKYTLPVDFRTKTEKTTDEAAFDEKTGTVKTASATAEDSPFLIAEVMPSFRGGDITAFRNWIQMHIKYPAEALKAKLYGRVVASFVIEKDGSVSDIQILQSPGKPLADEARRVIASSPAGAWTPGEQRGQAVRVKLTVPVDFRIQGADGKTSERTEKPKGSLDEIVVVGFGAPEK